MITSIHSKNEKINFKLKIENYNIAKLCKLYCNFRKFRIFYHTFTSCIRDTPSQVHIEKNCGQSS